jgi:ketosteroid isomerase-like protein
VHPVQTPITGNEPPSGGSLPYDALAQFYRAFNSRDLRLMTDNWAQIDEIAMDNPLGGIKRGWNEIRGVYERIFNGPAEVYVEYFDYTIHESADMFYAVGRERGYFRKGGAELALAIRTSRIFRKIEGQWKQVHHHGSIEDPELLAAYQKAVAG